MKIKPYTLAILISGNGSNLQAIIDAIAANKLPTKIGVVFSDQEKAFGLERAKKAGIQTVTLNPKNYATREDFDVALKSVLDRCSPDLIILAGFMRILSTPFVQAFKGRLINIHPALLPKYKGLHTYEKALEAGEKEHGTTVHLVTEALDGGPIIAQAKLPIMPDETVESLKRRTQALEHYLYPEVVGWFAKRKLQVLAKGIFFEKEQIPPEGILVEAETSEALNRH